MEQIKVIIGRDKAAPSVSTTESLAKTCPSLSRTQRMIGFGACFCLGYLISFGVRPPRCSSWCSRYKLVSLTSLHTHTHARARVRQSTFALIGGSANGAKFGITYSLGNIIALCGSGFLVGPTEQVKLMMKPVRRVAAVIYLSMIIIVLAVAIAVRCACHFGSGDSAPLVDLSID